MKYLLLAIALFMAVPAQAAIVVKPCVSHEEVKNDKVLLKSFRALYNDLEKIYKQSPTAVLRDKMNKLARIINKLAKAIKENEAKAKQIGFCG